MSGAYAGIFGRSDGACGVGADIPHGIGEQDSGGLDAFRDIQAREARDGRAAHERRRVARERRQIALEAW